MHVSDYFNDNHKKIITYVLIGIIGIIILFFIVINKYSYIGSQGTAVPTENPTITPDTTSTWGKFKSPSGYAVKFPKEMNLNVGGTLPYDFQLTLNGLSVTFFVVNLPPSATITTYGLPHCASGSSGNIVTQSINGNVFYRTPSLNNASEIILCQEAVTLLGRNNRIIDIQATVSDTDSMVLFNHILSTLTVTAQ